MTASVPAPRSPGRYVVSVVCLGNICRSPMADVVLQARVADAGLDDRVEVLSAGTGDWHAGDRMDRRAAALLTSEGYDASRHRAQQVLPDWLDQHDLVLAMDQENLRDLRALGALAGAGPQRLRLFRDFDPAGPGDVPDPYYGGDAGFRGVLDMVERTADALVAQLAAVVPD
ncbi:MULTISPECIES: low molecular weight protein-tyrosine-phosphatase [unclassified Nocardioides]|jgi:protein-tyrosine phosphatase|uniref:low molecular weight protein-tyrosine-phosphatase n=1 Tax=unclassified Nocardioides TaxID=2615069 RepID=UPI0007027422|nr:MULTISPECIES: low molecular weight protein-tyrosine-phosphatase [unclassified Nocardioides]KRC52935.1 protein tyrosine phosphatase [Nocardioides sp. Root79]KRC72466.1 protein tyrosine phosphatase [Nocardioides sp. Root240]